MIAVSTYALFVQAFEAFLALPRERLLRELELTQARRREQGRATSLCLTPEGFTLDESLPASLSTHSTRMIAVPFPDTDDVEALVTRLIQQVSCCLGDHFTTLWRQSSRAGGREQAEERAGAAHNNEPEAADELNAGRLYLPTALLEKVYPTWPRYSYRLTIRARQLTHAEEVPPLDGVSEAFRIYSLTPLAHGEPGDYRCLGLRGERFFAPRRLFEGVFQATGAPDGEDGFAPYTNRRAHTVQAVQIPFPFLVQGTMGRKDRPGQPNDFLFRSWFTTWDLMDELTFALIYRYSLKYPDERQPGSTG